MNKLPRIYAGNAKNKGNNKKVAVVDSITKEVKKEDPLFIREKINNLFKQNVLPTKIKVVISTNKGTTTEEIIGKNKDYLITMSNKLIPINDITSISTK